jgi:hypothetical protein
MMRQTGLLSAMLLISSLCAHMSGANLVANGSFEGGTLGIGSFQGWQTNLGDTSTFVDSNGTTGPLYGQAFDGLWAAYLGSTAAAGGATISQNVATEVGQQYLLTFALANDNAGLIPGNSFRVNVNNAPVFSLVNLPNQPYVSYQFSFVASSGQTPLAFFGSNDSSFLELDNVAVSAVPEPAALGLCLTGAVLAVLFRRHKTTQ